MLDLGGILRFRRLTAAIVLAAATALLLAASPPSDEPGKSADKDMPSYVGSNFKTCKKCHTQQVQILAQSGMASTYERLSSEERTGTGCVPCHTTGFGRKTGFRSVKDTPGLVNVQCEECHGPASQHLEVPITAKELRRDTQSMPNEEDCQRCHNEKSPTFDGFDYTEALAAIKHWDDTEPAGPE